MELLASLAYIVFLVLILVIVFPSLGIFKIKKSEKEKVSENLVTTLIKDDKENILLEKENILVENLNNNENKLEGVLDKFLIPKLQHKDGSQITEELVIDLFFNNIDKHKKNIDLKSNKSQIAGFPFLNNKTGKMTCLSKKDVIIYNQILSRFKKGEFNSKKQVENYLNENM